MKTTSKFALIGAVALLGGCATSAPVGGVFTDITLPIQATSAQGGTKTGTSQCTSILSLLATGDCSIEAAKANGGITEVTSVDWKANNILGIIGNYTTTVRGN